MFSTAYVLNAVYMRVRLQAPAVHVSAPPPCHVRSGEHNLSELLQLASDKRDIL